MHKNVEQEQVQVIMIQQFKSPKNIYPFQLDLKIVQAPSSQDQATMMMEFNNTIQNCQDRKWD